MPVNSGIRLFIAKKSVPVAAVQANLVPDLKIVGIDEFADLVRADQRTGLAGHVLMNGQIVDGHIVVHALKDLDRGIGHG